MHRFARLTGLETDGDKISRVGSCNLGIYQIIRQNGSRRRNHAITNTTLIHKTVFGKIQRFQGKDHLPVIKSNTHLAGILIHQGIVDAPCNKKEFDPVPEGKVVVLSPYRSGNLVINVEKRNGPAGAIVALPLLGISRVDQAHDKQQDRNCLFHDYLHFSDLRNNCICRR